MKVIVPQKVSLLYSSVEENDAPAWSASSTYAKRDEVLHNHTVYRSLIDNNTNRNPELDENRLGTGAAWQDVGASNRWKMFDDIIGTQTEKAGEGGQSITVKTDFKLSSGFALLNVAGNRLVVDVYHGDKTEPYWHKEYTLVKPVRNWWDWYFLPITSVRDVVAVGIPASAKSRIEFTIYGASRVAIGSFVHGMTKDIGRTKYDATAEIRSWSKKEQDSFGNYRYIPGRNAKRNDLDLFIPAYDTDTVYEIFRDLDGAPAMWMGDNRDSAEGGLQMLTVYGWCESMREVVRGPSETQVALTIQGLV